MIALNIDVRYCVMGLLITCGLCVFEYLLLGHVVELYLSNILVVVFTMLTCMKLENQHVNIRLEKIGREHSLNIYLYHIFLIPYINKLIAPIELLQMIRPIVLFLATYSLSVLLELSKAWIKGGNFSLAKRTSCINKRDKLC